MVRACAQFTGVPIVMWAYVVCRMCGCGVCSGVPIGEPLTPAAVCFSGNPLL